PYRLWYVRPEVVVSYPQLFDGMTINAATPREDKARWLNHYGITAISWAWGMTGYAKSQEWYASRYQSKLAQSDYKWAGIAPDEWNGGTEEMRDWAANALRETRKKYPDTFIAVWVTATDSRLIELLKENVIDLVMIEGYP